MFSGIVETTGTIINIQTNNGCKHMIILPHHVFHDVAIGDSIAVNGVCLTVTQFTNDAFHMTVVPETLQKTNLDHLAIGDKVNLERSLKLSNRLNGHLVQGHIDAMGEILTIESIYQPSIHNKQDTALLANISFPKKLSPYLIEKGFVTLDGMSITIIDITQHWFSVTFIPHTQKVTIIDRYRKGSLINIEVDVIGKYIEKILGAYTHAS